jgi:hypothetical protein
MRGRMLRAAIVVLLLGWSAEFVAEPAPSSAKPKSKSVETRAIRTGKKPAAQSEAAKKSAPKPEQPAIEKVAPPEPFDYGPDPDKPKKKASTEELLEGPHAGLVTTSSSMLIGFQVIHNPGMNLQFPAVLGGATDIGFGLSPFTIYADQIYFWKMDMSSAWMSDLFIYHDLRGQFLLAAGAGLEAGSAIGIRGLIGGQYSFPSLPLQLYGNLLALYHLGNAESAGGASWGASLGARVML